MRIPFNFLCRNWRNNFYGILQLYLMMFVHPLMAQQEEWPDLEELTLYLQEVYVTPDGRDPAVYILERMDKAAQANRKRLRRYDAHVVHDFHAQDVDFIPSLIPKVGRVVMRGALKLMRMDALYDHCVNHQQVEARLSSEYRYRDGKTSYADQRVLHATPSLSDKARKQLFRHAEMELFDRLYGENMIYGPKQRKEYKISFRGTCEEDGKTLNVLMFTPKDTTVQLSLLLYVVEGEWGIKRSIMKSRMLNLRWECTDIGSGIYMPARLIDDPRLLDLNQIYATYKARKAPEPDDDVSKAMKRLEKILQGNRTYRPYMIHRYQITYSGVEIIK